MASQNTTTINQLVSHNKTLLSHAMNQAKSGEVSQRDIKFVQETENKKRGAYKRLVGAIPSEHRGKVEHPVVSDKFYIKHKQDLLGPVFSLARRARTEVKGALGEEAAEEFFRSGAELHFTCLTRDEYNKMTKGKEAREGQTAVLSVRIQGNIGSTDLEYLVEVPSYDFRAGSEERTKFDLLVASKIFGRVCNALVLEGDEDSSEDLTQVLEIPLPEDDQNQTGRSDGLSRPSKLDNAHLI